MKWVKRVVATVQRWQAGQVPARVAASNAVVLRRQERTVADGSSKPGRRRAGADRLPGAASIAGHCDGVCVYIGAAEGVAVCLGVCLHAFAHSSTYNI